MPISARNDVRSPRVLKPSAILAGCSLAAWVLAFAAPGCTNNGSNGYQGGECLDTTDDCTKTCGCKTLGLCKRQGRTCVVVSNEACKQSEACKTVGACSLIGDRCRPSAEEDCANSKFCKVAKLCHFENGACVNAGAPSGSASAQGSAIPAL